MAKQYTPQELIHMTPERFNALSEEEQLEVRKQQIRFMYGSTIAPYIKV